MVLDERKTSVGQWPLFVIVIPVYQPGVNKGDNARKVQKLLEELAEKLRNEEAVSVRVNPEPDNPFDSNADAFQTPVNGKWINIGYVVREAAPHVA